MSLKDGLSAAIGTIGALIANLLGGWDSALITLLLFMAVDYFSGLVVAGVFHNSTKTASGALESKAGWKGICRKGISLLIVLIACRLDIVIGSDYIRDAVVIAFILNESISIIENAGLMGVPIPEVITKSIEVLRAKHDKEVESANKVKTNEK